MQPYQDCISDAQKKNESECGLEARRAAVADAETAISVRCKYDSACTSKGIKELMNGKPLISFTDENGRLQIQNFNEIVWGALNNPNSRQNICFKNRQDSSIKKCDIDPGQVACIPDSSCNDGNSRSFSSRSAVSAKQPQSKVGAFVSTLLNFVRPAPVNPINAPAYVTPTYAINPAPAQSAYVPPNPIQMDPCFNGNKREESEESQPQRPQAQCACDPDKAPLKVRERNDWEKIKYSWCAGDPNFKCNDTPS